MHSAVERETGSMGYQVLSRSWRPWWRPRSGVGQSFDPAGQKMAGEAPFLVVVFHPHWLDNLISRLDGVVEPFPHDMGDPVRGRFG